MIAEIEAGERNVADTFFLLSAILAFVAAVLAGVPAGRGSFYAMPIAFIAVGFVALGLFVL